MLDFLKISTRSTRKGVVEIYPKFIINNTSSDLMIRGGDFYAVWLEDKKCWSKSEDDLIKLIDNELDIYAKEHARNFDDHVKIMYLWDSETGMIDVWHKYCQKQLRDNYFPLDEKLIFLNQETKKDDYASKRLNYPLEEGPFKAYDELISTLYSEDERHKIEWAIGSVITGDSKNIQKFLVLYGPPGSGKSTILNIIQMLFDGYYSVFDAESLGSATDVFALEQFKSNPLVAISHDGDLSRIERNTRLNSLVSHEKMMVNEKHKSLYSMRFNSFLFMGTNKPVKITDAKSGLIRRLIDVNPSGNKLSLNKYNKLMNQIQFELGAIAYHCREVYLEDPRYYDDYKPILMMGESNDFYNYVLDSYFVFQKEDGVTLKAAWEMYKNYCDDAKVPYPLSMRIFKSELKSYFKNYEERIKINDEWVRSYFSGFKTDIFENEDPNQKVEKPQIYNFNKDDFISQPSKLDIFCKDCPAQYANEFETPSKRWSDVTTTLKDIDTSKLHYVKVQKNHIVIDFDIRDENGNKCFDRNLEEANKFPKTYAELSKSGGGIHLHYIYDGDVSKLSSVYADDIEVKVFNGNSALRRKLTKCNNYDIATINTGLPFKGEEKMTEFKVIANEKALRTIIKKNLNKEYHSATKPSMDFIFKSVEDFYKSGQKYDITDMYNIILAFASSSTNQSDYCINLVTKMHFKSDDPSEFVDNSDKPIVFYDVEVFPNLFVVNWKKINDKTVNKMINPTPKEIEYLLNFRLVGFNCRRYDNHILYARLIGKSNEELFKLSQKIINTGKDCFFGEAYNLSYTDIYDYATKKQSLKKWEIELGIHHQELGLPWDQPVPEEKWELVAEYCVNDVLATEAVWNATQDDFIAREILADIAEMSVNDTTNSLTTKIIFEGNKNPELTYVDLSKEFPGYEFIKKWNDITQKYDKFNMYRGVDLGFGGYVYAEPNIYYDVGLLDVASLHPHSIIAMNLFGKYTKNFKDLVDTRVYIKHKEFDKAAELFNGKLKKYLEDVTQAKKLAFALKIAINSVYGLTSASFSNPFRDPRNENNIVALRGALFMKTLQDEVVKKGYTVAHIKTDSIKIPNIDNDIIDFCMNFAKKYGYTFEHEATYKKMCLVNNAVYIAYEDGEWTATGTQFQIPYVFKKCFSKEEIVFSDLCETKEAKVPIYLNMNEKNPDELQLKFIGKVGSFCPIKPGKGGGELVKEVKKKDGNVGYDAVTGTKGYRWLESEYVKEHNLEDDIDLSYYDKLVKEAIETINEYGSYEEFINYT